MTKAELSAAELQAYARRAITQLNNAVRTLRIHEPTAPSVTSVLEALAGSLNGLADHFDAPVRLEVASDVVFVNEVRVRITATSAAQVEVLEGELRSVFPALSKVLSDGQNAGFTVDWIRGEQVGA